MIVLAREEAGAEKIFRGGGVVRLVRMVEEEREVELQVTAVRVLSCMCKDNKTRVSECVVFFKRYNMWQLTYSLACYRLIFW